MPLMAYDPQRLDALRHRVASAVEDLAFLRCDDGAATDATTAVRRALQVLGDLWLPRIDRLRRSPVLTHYVAGAVNGWASAWVAIDDPRTPLVPHAGALAADISDSAAVQSFPIPVWSGRGVTRIQFFIDDADVCPSGAGPHILCGAGDGRTPATGTAMSDYDLSARVRIVLDHEAGLALVIAYPTRDSEGREVPALPIELTVDGPVSLPDYYPSQVRVWTRGDGIDGNIVFDYRFLNSLTPAAVGGVAPAINGAIRVRRPWYPDEVDIDGRLAQYPTVEIIRDHQLPNGFHSAEIFVKQQDSGGPLNLYEPGEPFAVRG